MIASIKYKNPYWESIGGFTVHFLRICEDDEYSTNFDCVVVFPEIRCKAIGRDEGDISISFMPVDCLIFEHEHEEEMFNKLLEASYDKSINQI